MTVRSCLVVRRHPGAATVALEHRDPDTAHALAWILDHFPTGAMLVLLNQWETTPTRGWRDLFHAAGPADTVHAALHTRYPPPNAATEKRRTAFRNCLENVRNTSHDNGVVESELLDWIAT